MLKQKTTVLFIIASIILVTHAWGLDFQEGRYEITSTIKMPGMSPPPTTITRCLTKQAPLPDQSTAGPNCKVIDMNTQANTVTWKMECDESGQKMRGSGKMVYHGDRFEGTVDNVIMAPEGNMTVNTTIKGKRVGPCQ
jgi:hypothetical protein